MVSGIGVLGITDSYLETILIYPNPVVNTLTIVATNTAISPVNIMDISGRVVQEIVVDLEVSYGLGLILRL